MATDLAKYTLRFFKDMGLNSDGLIKQPLPGDGSKRLFERISLPESGHSFIFMANPPIDGNSQKENLAYAMIGKHLHAHRIPVPEIYRYNLDQGWFIMEDLGNTSLQDAVSETDDPVPVYKEVLENLFRLQVVGAEDFNKEWCYQTQTYDRAVMRQFESNYFKDAFLCHYLGLKNVWPELDSAFDYLAEMASLADSGLLLHRDFQSRNILVSKRGIGIIDWQGARLGPQGYDLASLLIDPYVQLSFQQKDQLFRFYSALIREHNMGSIESFAKSYPYLALQRNLQILGAFSYLTKTMKKTHFEVFIPNALLTLTELLHSIPDPELSSLVLLVDSIRLP
jgi:aminoglycoside/choline kinase family phosphotransferase